MNYQLPKTVLLVMSLLFSFSVFAGGEREQVLKAINNYIDGTSYNDQKAINSAFHPEANLYLEKSGKSYWRVPIKEYVSWFESKKSGQFNGRIGKVMSVDIEGNIATAKVEILMPKKDMRFVDMFLLKKLDNDWKILSKSAVKTEETSHGNRILFILSNAHFHGDSKLPAGVSFSEIVKAYDTFKKAGYIVDFVTPEGGALPLSYINTSEPIHKKYLYDADFMYAIEHTMKPKQVDASLYQAVHYVGGSNAMYGVAENEELQAISMYVYEKNNGIVSSVCHGTAGIVNLKTSDGKYLVDGKRISGYPESFENQSRAYFILFMKIITYML